MVIEKNEIIEGEKLIAGFMDIERVIGPTLSMDVYLYPFKNQGDMCYNEGDLKYHSSWDWLMPVIDKINDMGKEYHFAIFKTYYSMSVEKGGKVFKDFSFAYSEYKIN